MLLPDTNASVDGNTCDALSHYYTGIYVYMFANLYASSIRGITVKEVLMPHILPYTHITTDIEWYKDVKLYVLSCVGGESGSCKGRTPCCNGE